MAQLTIRCGIAQMWLMFDGDRIIIAYLLYGVDGKLTLTYLTINLLLSI
ncbi:MULTISPECIES: hypothetical protein [Oscillatoriales]|uniref:Uncharacterized protein n=2 Tax=Limnospira TaxID=2596745 RepID=A0A9P1KG42_9CYAN|nr:MULTISPECIES: hypothetical protein [Oscillatoriales]MBD2668099.1 hypothetical protein [Arthrospira platensis FACHB-439]MBD2709190.1 hypothetical protein [Arthrospira platensis FACHB-835]MDC0839056.1 hypothetical protein [Limnoraphis robusta]MDT9309173.1 hypothetical protein [Limnospira sp. Paracas R14]MDY7054062.1 hypothetical protein [Limnospira fusiformis LS22]QJB26690.1 hypothetical protein HFV01_13840 [Limnospira fusiformis SAG 85.79]QQW28321.1 hypothetical protein AP9108_25400 [Arthr